jgi:hypothetical protein
MNWNFSGEMLQRFPGNDLELGQKQKEILVAEA